MPPVCGLCTAGLSSEVGFRVHVMESQLARSRICLSITNWPKTETQMSFKRLVLSGKKNYTAQNKPLYCSSFIEAEEHISQLRVEGIKK